MLATGLGYTGHFRGSPVLQFCFFVHTYHTRTLAIGPNAYGTVPRVFIWRNAQYYRVPPCTGLGTCSMYAEGTGTRVPWYHR
jgi:hypothetical protein